MDHHVDETDTSAPSSIPRRIGNANTPSVSAAAALAHSLSLGRSFKNPVNIDQDRSRRVYEQSFARSANESTDFVDIPFASNMPQEERHAFSVRRDITTASCCSAPTDEEEDAGRIPTSPPNPSYSSAARLNCVADAPDETVQLQNHPTPSSPRPLTPPPPPPVSPPPPLPDSGGGRLWRLAGEVAAAKKAALLETTRTGAVGHIAETLMERMRSRADPNAQVAPPTPPRPNLRTAQPIIVKMTTQSDEYREDEAFLMNTGLAHKRVRVVQLLIIGLVGILLAWLGNFFVTSSCYFVSVPVAVGQYGDIFPLHFGLWNYSPIDSALNGYKYCYPYSGSRQSDAPILSRAFNLAALLAGTYSLGVLWCYLISGRAVSKFWRAAVYAALLAGMLQIATPLVFLMGTLCRKSSCSAGPAAALSAVTAVAWVIVGAELHYHCPVVAVDDVADTVPEAADDVNSNGSKGSTTPVAQLEMADLAGASQEFLDRFHKKHASRRRYKPPDLA